MNRFIPLLIILLSISLNLEAKDNSLERYEEFVNSIVEKYQPQIYKEVRIKQGKTFQNKLCDTYTLTSISCEIRNIELENRLTKKKIDFLLKKISKKFVLNEKITTNLKNSFFNYVENIPRLKGNYRYCLSTICTIKDVKDELKSFEDILISILDNKIKKKSLNIDIDGIKKLFKDNLKRLGCNEKCLKNNDIFEGRIYGEYYFTREKSKKIRLLNKYWEDLELNFIFLIKEIKIKNGNLLKQFYFLGYEELINIASEVRSIVLDPECGCEGYNIPKYGRYKE